MADQTIANLLDLSGRAALITGASRGIGRTMAEVFARAGAKVALAARSAELLAEVAAGLRAIQPAQPGSGPDEEAVLALPADVADEVQVNQIVRQMLDAWGRVDILINNAALLSSGSIDQIAPADWERLIGVNLSGAYLCSRAVIPAMRRQQSGRIINISSITAQTGGVSGGAHYAASKGGLLAMTKTLARDLAPFNITVNAIAPGQIETDASRLTDEARRQIIDLVPLGRLGKAEEIAYAALFLASPMADYITGATLDVNGGILKR